MTSLLQLEEGSQGSSKKTTTFCLGYRVPSSSLWNSRKVGQEGHQSESHRKLPMELCEAGRPEAWVWGLTMARLATMALILEDSSVRT